MKLSIHLLIIAFSITFLAACKNNAKEPCTLLGCQNGGTCERGICKCPEWTYGDTCQLNVLEKILGNYNVKAISSYACNDNAYEIEIIKNTILGSNYVTVKNFDGYGTNVFGKAKGGDNQFPLWVEVPSQVVGNKTINGIVKVQYDLIVGNLSITTACYATITRKF